jgi:hypothetical protein
MLETSKHGTMIGKSAASEEVRTQSTLKYSKMEVELYFDLDSEGGVGVLETSKKTNGESRRQEAWSIGLRLSSTWIYR